MKKLKDYLLENYVDEDGDLNISGLDFSDFDGNVYIGRMEVKRNLSQSCQKVSGHLYQTDQKVEGYLHQGNQKVEGNLIQNHQKVEGNLYQDKTVEGNLLKHILRSEKMKTIKEIRDWLLNNAVDEDGDLNISGLDFSDFDGRVIMNGMKVKGDLVQDYQVVKGHLFQHNQEVGGDLIQNKQKVEVNLWQDKQTVEGNLYQTDQEVEGNLLQDEEIKVSSFESTEIENEIPKQTETKATHRTGFIGDSVMPKEKQILNNIIKEIISKANTATLLEMINLIAKRDKSLNRMKRLNKRKRDK